MDVVKRTGLNMKFSHQITLQLHLSNYNIMVLTHHSSCILSYHVTISIHPWQEGLYGNICWSKQRDHIQSKSRIVHQSLFLSTTTVSDKGQHFACCCIVVFVVMNVTICHDVWEDRDDVLALKFHCFIFEAIPERLRERQQKSSNGV